VIVEVRGANTRNKGAELMLRSISRELQAAHHHLVVGPRSGSYDERARMGLMQKVENSVLPANWLALVARGLPEKVRRHARCEYGLVFEPDVEALVDASGFAYSDQFDVERSLIAADRVERAKRRGRRVILLPQALGPFRSKAHRDAFRRIADCADLLYARDHVSLAHAQDAEVPSDRLRLAPDFTCLLEGELPPRYEAPDRLALVVPSAKLLTETSEEVRESYLPFLASSVEILRSMNLNVSALQHEQGDGRVIAGLNARLPVPVQTLSFDSALHLKGIIGRAEILLGSRFHALVSALSQGVPAVGVGWSHKYEMLFEDYGCPNRLLQPTVTDAALADHLRAVVEEPMRSEFVDSLQRAAARERQRVREMWTEVHSRLGVRAEN
jgi:polysaccharide pyruvyl transferase WcaK-like protein